MSNIITDIGHGIKVAAVDTVHAVEEVVGALPKAVAVLSTALKNEATLKTTVLNLIEEGAKVIGDGTLAAASKGTNVVEDAATIADAEAFLTYFKNTFLPAVASLYGELKADITGTTATPAATPTAEVRPIAASDV